MKPGRELDLLIADKVMGIKFEDCKPVAIGFKDNDFKGLHYSTDISAAWEVVEKVQSIGRNLEMFHRVLPHGKCYVAGFPAQGEQAGLYAAKIQETASHAICMAALKAVGYNPINTED